MPSQTRKKSQPRSPKVLGDLEWLRDPKQMLARADSFRGKEMTDEEFYKFFNEIGEVYDPPKNKRYRRNQTKSRRGLVRRKKRRGG